MRDGRFKLPDFTYFPTDILRKVVKHSFNLVISFLILAILLTSCSAQTLILGNVYNSEDRDLPITNQTNLSDKNFYTYFDAVFDHYPAEISNANRKFVEDFPLTDDNTSYVIEGARTSNAYVNFSFGRYEVVKDMYIKLIPITGIIRFCNYSLTVTINNTTYINCSLINTLSHITTAPFEVGYVSDYSIRLPSNKTDSYPKKYYYVWWKRYYVIIGWKYTEKKKGTVKFNGFWWNRLTAKATLMLWICEKTVSQDCVTYENITYCWDIPTYKYYFVKLTVNDSIQNTKVNSNVYYIIDYSPKDLIVEPNGYVCSIDVNGRLYSLCDYITFRTSGFYEVLNVPREDSSINVWYGKEIKFDERFSLLKSEREIKWLKLNISNIASPLLFDTFNRSVYDLEYRFRYLVNPTVQIDKMNKTHAIISVYGDRWTKEPFYGEIDLGCVFNAYKLFVSHSVDTTNPVTVYTENNETKIVVPLSDGATVITYYTYPSENGWWEYQKIGFKESAGKLKIGRLMTPEESVKYQLTIFAIVFPVLLLICAFCWYIKHF